MPQQGSKPKKIPMRLCVGCGERHPKRELIRVVRSPEGTFSLDFTGKAQGRGAYLCPKAECLQAAKKGHRLERSFSCAIDPAVYEALERELSEEAGET